MFQILFSLLHFQQHGMKANVLALFSLVISNFVAFIVLTRQTTQVYTHNFINKQNTL